MDDDYPEMTCPKCGRESPDMDGFGLMFCVGCGYCTHASITDDVCNFCGSVQQHGEEPAK